MKVIAKVNVSKILSSERNPTQFLVTVAESMGKDADPRWLTVLIDKAWSHTSYDGTKIIQNSVESVCDVEGNITNLAITTRIIENGGATEETISIKKGDFISIEGTLQIGQQILYSAKEDREKTLYASKYTKENIVQAMNRNKVTNVGGIKDVITNMFVYLTSLSMLKEKDNTPVTDLVNQ